MKATKPYFSHDTNSTQDEKIIRLFFDFRKISKELPDSVLRTLAAHGAYGLFWEIVEYLHENNLSADEADMLADKLRIDADILNKILNDFDLFKIEDGKYVSDRIMRNLKLQEEKSEKARQAVRRRYKGKEETSEEYNEETVDAIIEIYNRYFGKEQIVSDKNKQKIFDINKKNKLTPEIWEKVFENAKRGWDIGDKKNVPPTLKKILDEWDSFASDDYFLAPDREAMARIDAELKAKKEIQEQELQEQIKEKEHLHRKKRALVNSKEAALEFLYDELPIISHKKYVENTKDFREFSKKYNIPPEEAMEYFAQRGERRA